MRKLLMLLMFIPLLGISQTVINPVTNDSVVRIPKAIAEKVLKDLNKKDALEKENVLLKQDTSTLGKIIAQYKKDSATQSLKDKLISDIRLQSAAKDVSYEKSLSTLQKQLNWSKIRTTGSELLLLGAVLYIIFGK